ncbi:hypothetical protein PGB90_002191 [Kerria lacca]
MSCPEVMYQAYYPYLYQRPSTSASSPANGHRTAHFSPFTHQYDRFNVQRSLDQPSTSSESYHIPHHSHTPSHHSSTGSISSNGGVGSPGSPTAVSIRYKEEDTPNTKEGTSSSERRETVVDEEEEDDAGSTSSNSRAQYMSANCVVFTHYTGDVQTVVEEHFTRALSHLRDVKDNVANTKGNRPNYVTEYSSMTSRNFPPSFWNSNYQAVSVSSAHPSDFYSGDSAYHAAVAAAASNTTGADPWHSHYQQYAAHHHHRAVHEYHHHHNMAAQYSSLLIPPTSRLPAHMAAAATHQYHHSKTATHHRLHHDQTASHHALDATTSPYSTYSPMTGLEAQVQESSKDLYWF